MPKIIDTVRFFEWGKPAPKNSRFKGTMNAKMIFGANGYMDYTGRKDAVEENVKDQLTLFEDGFLGYTSRESASTGSTVSSLGVLTPEKRRELRRQGTEAFNKPGDLIWDMVISLESYEEAHKNYLYHQADYAAAIEKILPQFFKKVGFDPTNMLWWMDYHSDKKHPHMHVVFMEKVHTRSRGAFTDKQMKTLKQIIAKELTVRQTVRELTGNDYDEQFSLKDQEKAEIIDALHNVDMSKIDSVQDLARILPKTGRMQYGSAHLIPYRESIDSITDQLLAEEPLKTMYEDYMNALIPLDKAMAIDAGSATIMAAELRKLHMEIGNIILRDIKSWQSRSGNTTVGKEELIRYSDDLEERLGYPDTETNTEKYHNLKDRHRAALRSNSSAELRNIYGEYEAFDEADASHCLKANLNHKLAEMEFYGEGIDKNLNLAKMHCMKAIEKGSFHSYALFSKICFARNDITDGINALYAGAINKDSLSEYLLGIALVQGKYCIKDKEQGMEYIRISAIHGYGLAQEYLKKHDSQGYTYSLHAYVARSVARHFSAHSVGNEVSGYIFNDDQIHLENRGVEAEIEAYLNNQKSQARRGR